MLEVLGVVVHTRLDEEVGTMGGTYKERPIGADGYAVDLYVVETTVDVAE